MCSAVGSHSQVLKGKQENLQQPVMLGIFVDAAAVVVACFLVGRGVGRRW